MVETEEYELPCQLMVRSFGTHGGTERFVYGFARYLLEKEVSFEVCCTQEHETFAGVKVEVVPLRARGRIWKSLALDRILSKKQQDGVCFGFVRGGNPTVYRVGGGSHRRWIVENGWSVADEVEWRIDRRIMSSARWVVVNSEQARRDVIADYEIESKKVVLIRTGVDTDYFQISKCREKNLLFLGNNFSRKGLKTALESLNYLPGWHLHVYGVDARWRYYRRLAKRIGVGERVSFAGFIQDPRVAFSQASVLVLPSRYDPASNVLLEAMASAVVPIGSSQDGMTEILPERWMILSPKESAKNYALAIEKAYSASGLSEQCRSIAESLSPQKTFASLFCLGSQ